MSTSDVTDAQLPISKNSMKSMTFRLACRTSGGSGTSSSGFSPDKNRYAEHGPSLRPDCPAAHSFAIPIDGRSIDVPPGRSTEHTGPPPPSVIDPEQNMPGKQTENVVSVGLKPNGSTLFKGSLSARTTSPQHGARRTYGVVVDVELVSSVLNESVGGRVVLASGNAGGGSARSLTAIRGSELHGDEAKTTSLEPSMRATKWNSPESPDNSAISGTASVEMFRTDGHEPAASSCHSSFTRPSPGRRLQRVRTPRLSSISHRTPLWLVPGMGQSTSSDLCCGRSADSPTPAATDSRTSVPASEAGVSIGSVLNTPAVTAAKATTMATSSPTPNNLSGRFRNPGRAATAYPGSRQAGPSTCTYRPTTM